MLSTRSATVSQHLWSAWELTANFLERASDADHGLDAVFGVVDSRDGLAAGHAGAGDGETDRLVKLDREPDAGVGDRMGDQLVVIGIALDHRADHHHAVDFLALEQSFYDRGHVVHAGNEDHARDFDSERLGVATCPLFHRRGHLGVELRNYKGNFHGGARSMVTASRISTPLRLRYDFSAGIGCSP